LVGLGFWGAAERRVRELGRIVAVDEEIAENRNDAEQGAERTKREVSERAKDGFHF